MDEKKQKELDRIFYEWKVQIARELTVEAYQAYMDAEMSIHEVYGLEIGPDNFNLISDAAKAYSKEYERILVEEGATVIKGEKVPWMAEMERAEREKVGRIIDESIANGEHIKDTGKKLDDHFTGRKNRAALIARTEVGRIANISTLRRYKEWGYTMVNVLDNEGPNSCDECKRANGQVWTIEKAMANELEHKSCVRAFSVHINEE